MIKIKRQPMSYVVYSVNDNIVKFDGWLQYENGNAIRDDGSIHFMQMDGSIYIFVSENVLYWVES